MEQLIQGAVAGSWPAAFAIAVMAVSVAAAVIAMFWCFAKMATGVR